MTRSTRLAALAAALALVSAAPPQTPTEAPPTARDADGPSEVAANLLKAHNRERSVKKLLPLSLDPKLTAAAKVQADDMAGHGKMSHEGSDGSTPFDRIKTQKYRFQAAGENVSEGQKSVEAVMKGWMNSPHHRDNILGKFSQAGFAVSRDEDGTPYWCAVFATPWPKLDTSRAAGDLVEAINKERAGAKKPPLNASAKLADASSRLAESLAREDSLEGPNRGDDLTAALKQSGYRYRKLAEAAAAGYPTAADVLKSWAEDEAQRANLLGDFTEVGVGYATSKTGKPYWCLLLASPLGG